MVDESIEVLERIEEYWISSHFDMALNALEDMLKEDISSNVRSEVFHWIGMCYMGIACQCKESEQDEAFELAEKKFRESFDFDHRNKSALGQIIFLRLLARKDLSDIPGLFSRLNFDPCHVIDARDDEFIEHSLLMTMGTVHCLLLDYDQGMEFYRIALKNYSPQELDFSTFIYFKEYGVTIADCVRDEVLFLLNNSDKVNSIYLSIVKDS